MIKRYVIVTQNPVESEDSDDRYESCKIASFSDPCLAVDYCVDKLLANAVYSLNRIENGGPPLYRYQDDACDLYVLIDGEMLGEDNGQPNEDLKRELINFDNIVQKEKEAKLDYIASKVKEYEAIARERMRRSRLKQYLELKKEFEDNE